MVEIFIKPSQKVSVTGKKDVLIKDVAEICCSQNPGDQKKIENMTVLRIKGDENRQYVVSALDMISKIYTVYPEAKIHCIGETETLVNWLSEPEKVNRVFEKIKIAFVCTVLFGGAMTAIMSFHSDAQMPAVFQNMYRIFFGVEATKPYIIYIPYSIGLAVGIIMFFNHIGMKKISRDPTPIEVEMTTYEKESADSIIDKLEKEKKNGNN